MDVLLSPLSCYQEGDVRLYSECNAAIVAHRVTLCNRLGPHAIYHLSVSGITRRR